MSQGEEEEEGGNEEHLGLPCGRQKSLICHDRKINYPLLLLPSDHSVSVLPMHPNLQINMVSFLSASPSQKTSLVVSYKAHLSNVEKDYYCLCDDQLQRKETTRRISGESLKISNINLNFALQFRKMYFSNS